MTDAPLDGLPIRDLLDTYNKRSKTKLKAWKGKRSALIERILALHREDPPPPPQPAMPSPQSILGPSKRKSIKQLTIELLQHVDYYEDRGRDEGPENRVPAGTKNSRSVGLSYGEIMARIIREIPTARYSINSLRWYAESDMIGRRPRSEPKKRARP